MAPRVCRFPGFRCLSLTVALLAGLAARPAPGQPLQGMPLVLPMESLPLVRQLNPNVTLRLVLVSAPRQRGRGDVRETAVVDLVTAQALPRRAAYPLLLPNSEVSAVQRLNQGVQIHPVATFKKKLQKKGPPTPITQISLTETTLALLDTPPAGPLLVVGTDCLPALGQFNPGMTFDILRFSQWGTGGQSSAQTALVCLGSQSGVQLPVPPFPLAAPAVEVTALQSLNTGWIIDTIEVTHAPTGQGPTLPVAQVQVRENQKALDRYSRVARGDDDDDDDDRGKNDDDDDDKDDSKGKGGDKDDDKDDDDEEDD